MRRLEGVGAVSTVESVEDSFELVIMLMILAFEILQSTRKVFMLGQDLPQFDERAYDHDIHLHGSLTVEDARQHGDFVLGERVRQVSSTAAALV